METRSSRKIKAESKVFARLIKAVQSDNAEAELDGLREEARGTASYQDLDEKAQISLLFKRAASPNGAIKSEVGTAV